MLTAADRRSFDDDGFVQIASLLTPARVDAVRARFEPLFGGEFETGTPPDEVNWQFGSGDPSLTRQLCSAWKADRTVATVVLDAEIGEAIATLAGWPGTRIVQDNLLWKPAGARSIGFHRDADYQSWHTPAEMLTCWIALDATDADGGTLEFATGSHRWPDRPGPPPEFHGPAEHRAPMLARADCDNATVEIGQVLVEAGGGSFHHGRTWHGSAPNRTDGHRRALAIHATSSEARFDRARLAEGTGPIYARFARPEDDTMHEADFPITWHHDGYRSPIAQELSMESGPSPRSDDPGRGQLADDATIQ